MGCHFLSQCKKIFHIYLETELVYCDDNQKITFSSESKLINSYLNISNTINILSIYSYLSYRQPIGNQTYFKNIKSLEPGYYIEVSNGKLKKKNIGILKILTMKVRLIKVKIFILKN